MPLAVRHSQRVSQTIRIFLPEEWDANDTKVDIEPDAFVYHSSVFYNNKTITLRYRYKTKKSFVEAGKTSDHFRKMDEVMRGINYMIYKEVDSSGNSRTKEFVIVALLIGVFVYFIKKRTG